MGRGKEGGGSRGDREGRQKGGGTRGNQEGGQELPVTIQARPFPVIYPPSSHLHTPHLHVGDPVAAQIQCVQCGERLQPHPDLMGRGGDSSIARGAGMAKGCLGDSRKCVPSWRESHVHISLVPQRLPFPYLVVRTPLP